MRVPIRVVLADDHNLVRAGLRALLERLPDVEVVGEASNGREALALIAKVKPEVALLDIGMPELNGLDAAARIAREAPRTRLVMVSMYATEAFVAQAVQLGVAGYVLKESCADELPVLLRAVMNGQTYLSPGVSQTLVGALKNRLGRDALGGEDAKLAAAAPESQLTLRQREVLQLVAEGKSTKEIASALELSVKTVETHRAQIMDRLGIRDVPGLVRYAIRLGLVSADR
ncbi:MAG TPA: response regulator transcription factor [Polyangia bacterium]|nr:response regulator transcription factor [Polyangia bacterium]